ncbi:MAG: ATP-binding protein [Anaerolineae bacterium]
MARIRNRVAQSWRRLSTATKLLVILDVLAVFLIIGFLVAISAVITQRMRVSVDTDLHHHIGTLRAIVAWEGYYMRAEARTLAGLEGVDDALRARDVQRLSRFVATIQDTHGLDAIYVVTGSGDVLLGSAVHGPDPAAVASLDLVREGFAGQNLNRFLVVDDKVWLAGVAPHVEPDGQIDAIFLLAREFDHDYLRDLSATLGADVVLTGGQLVVSSLSPDDHDRLLATEWLPDPLTTEELRLQDMRIGNVPYRLLVAPLSPADSPALIAGLLQPTRLIDDAIRQTIVRVAVLGVLLVSVPFVLIQFLIRAVFKPLQSLRQAAEVIAAGNLDQSVQVQGTAEVQALATSFDQMRIRLQSYLEEQRQWNEELDAQVRVRTRELERLCRVRDRLVAKLISAQEDERQRVARELHDETSQVLANLVVTLGTVARLTGDGETHRHLEQAKRLAVDTLEGVNRIVLDLRPRLLDDYGLLPAIRWYAEERLDQAKVDVMVEVQGTEMRLPTHTETGIFRVIQEAVNNIVRHAHATQARVRLTWEPSLLTVEIEDNGRGFDVQETMSGAERDRSLGLLGMQERVALVNGTLAIDSIPDTGTRILIRVPLPQTVEANVQD